MSVLIPSLRAAIAVPQWSKNELWRKARAVPSLDLRFAENKSLVDATTGANLVTFTRASGGTYTDSQGVIRNAVTNLLLRSEEFDNASWTVVTAGTASAPVLTPAYAEAPNGGLTAYRLQANRGAGNTTSDQSTINNSVSGLPDPHNVTISIWAKSNTGASQSVYFRNSTGSGGGEIIVTPVWQRFSISGSRAGSTFNSLQIGSRGTGNSTNSVDILIWGAQLEQSSTVGEYVPTGATINSAPRFDHNPTTGESLGLLVEEQRVNYCLQSEAFGTSPWAASNVTVTPNTETSPAATLTADTLTATSANGTVTQPVTTTAVAMTFSVYLKRKTGTGNIDITADGSTWVTQTINSSTWTRCIVTQTAVAGTSNPGIRIVTSGDEVYAWGGQYE